MATENKKKKKNYFDLYPTLSQEEKKEKYEELTTQLGLLEKKKKGYTDKIAANKKDRKSYNFFEKLIPIAVCSYICACMAYVAPVTVFLFFAVISTIFLERRLHVISNTVNKIKSFFVNRKMKKLEKQREYLQECYKSADRTREDLGLNTDREIDATQARNTTQDRISQLEDDEEIEVEVIDEEERNKPEAVTQEKKDPKGPEVTTSNAQNLVEGLADQAAQDAANLAGLYQSTRTTPTQNNDTGKQ